MRALLVFHLVASSLILFQQPISKQTLMKSNAQLRRDDSDDEEPPPAAMPVGFPDMASSSHTVPPSEPEVNYAQIMEALAALQEG